MIRQYRNKNGWPKYGLHTAAIRPVFIPHKLQCPPTHNFTNGDTFTPLLPDTAT